MAAVATMMTSLFHGELDATRRTALAAVIAHPVVDELGTTVGGRHHPAPHAALGVAHVHPPVIAACASETMERLLVTTPCVAGRHVSH